MDMRRKYNLKIDIKKNICQNMKIARKLSGYSVDKASELLDITNEHLKRIEAPNFPNYISFELLYIARGVYKKDANFFFNSPSENEKLLK